MRRATLLITVMAVMMLVASGVALAVTKTGGPGNDTLVGPDRPDILSGEGGKDAISGLGGDDGISGDAGNDSISGGSGAEYGSGGPGDHSISLGAGDDGIVPRSIVSLDPCADHYIGGDGGDDTISGGKGDDTINGDRCSSFTLPGYGSDDISGGPGQDELIGGLGSDLFLNGDVRAHREVGVHFGDRAQDELSGGSIDDRIMTVSRSNGETEPGRRDIVNCGSGFDIVHADRVDLVASDCERTWIRNNIG